MPIKQVNLGRRRRIYDCNESLNRQLEYGRDLRKSKDFPIYCEIILNRERKKSKNQIEQEQQKLKKQAQKGKIDEYTASIPVHRYEQLPSSYPAIIPTDGITRKGYVKEVWVSADTRTRSVEIGNQHYTLIDPFVHNLEQWIMGFILDNTNLIGLLPSREIVVRYYVSQTI